MRRLLGPVLAVVALAPAAAHARRAYRFAVRCVNARGAACTVEASLDGRTARGPVPVAERRTLVVCELTGTSAPAILPRLMAVPKQKQSHSRTTKRRSNHKAAVPTLNECPQCHKPRRPHRVCPSCGFYAGREVVAPAVGHHDHDH